MRFETIVCGVDGSAESYAALEQARRLLAPGGRLVAVTACDETLAVHAGAGAGRIAAELRAEAAATRAAAERLLERLSGSTAVIVRGRAAGALRRVVERERADLLVVGSSGTGRAVGALLGSVATTMLHEAPCPVLVARPAPPGAFPRRIVVGVDGSPESLRAHAVAVTLAATVGATLRAITASAEPVAALTAASADADLVVLGSRGRRGVASLGSVGERVAHRARCSVLVLRPAPDLGRGRHPGRMGRSPDGGRARGAEPWKKTRAEGAR